MLKKYFEVTGIRKEELKMRVAFYGLFGVLGIFILLTPHLFMDHFLLNKNVTQSLALLAELVIGYFFYRFYKGKMKNLYSQKTEAEERLAHSYGYIGKMNNIIDIFKNFGHFFPQKNKITEKDERDIFNDMLSNIVVSIAKTDRGFLRFIDVESGHTDKEFYFSKKGEVISAKVSNAAILEERSVLSDEAMIVESDYRCTGICCVVWIAKSKDVDSELVKALLNQAHLLYLVYHKKHKI